MSETIYNNLGENGKRFLVEYEAQLIYIYRQTWAGDKDKLKRFMGGVVQTIGGQSNIWNPPGPAYTAACKELGFDAPLPMKALRIWCEK